MKIAALQLPTLPLSNKKLATYIKKAKDNGAKIIVLGEYVINTFFKELVNMRRNMVAIQTKNKVEALEYYAKEFNIHIVAPVIQIKEDKIYKTLAYFSPQEKRYKNQEFLINYSHWDEEDFFDNEISGKIDVLNFNVNGFNICAINGYEIHFDCIWEDILKKDSDLVLVSSASTFGSNQRWNEILKTRAFVNSLYILRVNRIGTYQDDGSFWNFYGETYLINPDGFIEESLKSQEGMLIADVEISELKEANSTWKFREHLRKRKLI